MELKTCKNERCGRQFLPKKKSQQYCNDDCRVAYYKEHYGSQEVKKVCPNCGNTFLTTMPKKQTYCGSGCREDAHRKRAEGALAQLDAETLTHYAERFGTLERDEFKCTYCGRGPKEGAVLGVIEDTGKLRTICTECKEGKEFIRG